MLISHYNRFIVLFHVLFLLGSLCQTRQKLLLKLLMVVCSFSLAPTDFCIQRLYQKGQAFKIVLHIKQHQITAKKNHQTQIAADPRVKTILVLCRHPRETDLSVCQRVSRGNQSHSLFFLTNW